MNNKKNANGIGTIRKRPNGSWEGRITMEYDERTGKQTQKSVYGRTQREVREKLRDLMDKRDDPGYIEPSDMKFSDWLDTWMEEYKRNSVRLSTYSTYEQMIRVHINPRIGDIPLERLRPEDIQKLFNIMSKGDDIAKACAGWTVLKAKNIINNSLEQAVKNRLIQFNPCQATTPPKANQKEIRILSENEQQKLVGALGEHRLRAFFMLALATGMRRGELMALTWDCIDFKNKSITIKGSISRIKDPDSGITELRFNDPKTKAGKRQIPLLDSMIPEMQAHKARQDEEKTMFGANFNPKNYVFCSNVGTEIEPRRINTTLAKILNAAGLEHVNFHALRHTFATRMLEANVPAKVVQEVLGHEDVTLTLNTYSHVLKSTAHEQMAKLNDLFAPKEKQTAKKPSITKALKEKSAEQTAKPKPVKAKKDEPEL